MGADDEQVIGRHAEQGGPQAAEQQHARQSQPRGQKKTSAEDKRLPSLDAHRPQRFAGGVADGRLVIGVEYDRHEADGDGQKHSAEP